MKKSKRVPKARPAARHSSAFRAGLFACALLVAGVLTAVVTYASRNAAPLQVKPVAGTAAPSADAYVTIEVGGRKLRVNAQTLQQGPLTQEQVRQIADQLEGNKATEGLVEEKHADGAVSIDLQDRFQNVTLAKRNEDGTVTTACVDEPKAAESFLNDKAPASVGTGKGTEDNRKALK